MLTPTERAIGSRFVWRATEEGKFSVMSLIVWLAIGVGVSAMTVLLSVMYGFENSLTKSFLKSHPHLMIQSSENTFFRWASDKQRELEKRDEIERFFPYLETEMVIQSQDRSLGAVVVGLRKKDLAQLESDYIEKSDKIYKNSFTAVVGSELAYRMLVPLEKTFDLISPIDQTPSPFAIPDTYRYQVSALYQSGHYDFDEKTLFVDLSEAQEMVGRAGVISGWKVWLHKDISLQDTKQAYQQLLGDDYRVMSWDQFNSALFQSLKLEQYAMFFVLCFALLIAMMNITISLVTTVTQKKRAIGVLRTMGATRKQIKNIFLWQGIQLGILGLLIAAVLTVAIFGVIEFLPSYFQLPDIYYDRSIPTEFRGKTVFAIYFLSFVLILFSSLIPASRASRVAPLEAIQI